MCRYKLVLLLFLISHLSSASAQTTAPRFQYPVNNYNTLISQNFGEINTSYDNKHHVADDLSAIAGTEVVSSANGRVMFSREWKDCPNWGHVLVVEHNLPDGSLVNSVYGHLDPSSIAVVEESDVIIGQLIGEIGRWVSPETGSPCWGGHLHFGIYMGAFDSPVGAYPSWLTGYLSGGVFPGQWSNPSTFIAGHLFFDDFEDGVIDLTSWEYSGNAVSEINGELHVDVNVTDQGGRANTGLIVIDKNKSLKISRKIKVHAANQYFDGRLGVRIEGYPEYNFGVSYANYVYSDGYSCPAYGIAIYRNGANSHVCPDQVTDVSAFINPVWDTWFDEEVRYDPRTGELVYMINGRAEITYNVGVLPEGADTIQIAFTPWGWWTGHYMHIDDFVVSQ